METAAPPTTYAIVGSGNIGTAIARLFARAGITTAITNRRGPDSLRPLVAELGDTIVPVPLDNALAAQILIVAIPFGSVAAFAQTRADWSGKIVIDATNALHVAPESLAGRLSSDIVADAFRGAKVVKTFNYLRAATLERDPADDGGRRVMFIAGDDDGANATVVALVERLGFAPSLLGRIDEGGRLLHQIPGPLVLHNLVEFPGT